MGRRGKDSSWGWSPASAGRRARRRHRRPVAAQAAAGPVPPVSAGFIPGCRIIGVSLDEIDADGFRKIAREALDQFSTRKVNEADWAAFAETLDYVPLAAGAGALKAAVARPSGHSAGRAGACTI